MPLPVVLINLDTSRDRLMSVQAQAEATGIVFERFPAIYGKSLRQEGRAGNYVAALADGEVGCYESHLACMRLMLSRKYDAMIVLEDDVVLTGEIMAVAEDAVAKAPRDWDYIHLSPVIKRSVHSLAQLTNGRELIQFSHLPVNTTAYLISSSGAQKFLAENGPRARPVDMEIRYGWLRDFNVFGVMPPVAWADPRFNSIIGERKTGKKIRLKHPWSAGVASEIHGVFWQMKKLGFGVWLGLFARNMLRLRPKRARAQV